MAPNFNDLTTVPSWGYYYTQRTRGPYEVYRNNGKSFESYSYDTTTSSETYWSHRDKYDTSYTQNLVYPTKQIEKNVKKLLKKMADELCRIGWSYYPPNYSRPKLQPINLRGVRLDGRGWANL